MGPTASVRNLTGTYNMAEPKRQIDLTLGFPSFEKLFPPPAFGTYVYFEGGERFPFEARALMPSLINSWWLADCSLLAYESPENIRAILRPLPFFIPDSFQWFHSKGKRLQANTQAFLLESEQFALLAFRGTEFPGARTVLRRPGKILDCFADMKTDLKLFPRPVLTGIPTFECAVHPGIAEALQTVWEPLMTALDAIGDKPLWITGHSLGGALATLLAYQIPERVAGLVSFGSLPVGTEEFASSYAAKGLTAKTLRVVHGKDPAPNLFNLIRDDYQPVGQLVCLDSREGRGAIGDWLRKATTNTMNVDPVDHAPIFYAYETWNAIN